MMALITKSAITAIVFCGFLSSQIAVAVDNRHLAGDEAAAISVAVEAFKKIYAKPDLRHYTVDFVRRKNELEVTFVPDDPQKVDSRHPGVLGGETVYGPAMTYVVSLKTLKIVRYNFYR
jgi:hypothetical protein